MPKPKKTTIPSKVALPEITEKVLKYWYVDSVDYLVKHVSEYKGKLVGYDPNKNAVITKEKKLIRYYATHREASIQLLKVQLNKKKEEWQTHVDLSYTLNEEIGKIVEDLSILEDIGE